MYGCQFVAGVFVGSPFQYQDSRPLNSFDKLKRLNEID
jgi:hypothetical protein